MYVQIGSGAANFDTKFEDGFSNFILKNNIRDKVFIVEANSVHLSSLEKLWESFPNIFIFNLAIIPDNLELDKIDFFYADEDKPNYQIFSSSKSFVKQHFPNSEIRKKSVKCKKISEFLKLNIIQNIEYLSIDIEGMDYEVLINFDFNKFDLKNVSFEHIHLNCWKKIKIILKLVKNGFFFSGMGFDVRKSDWMFSRGYKHKILTTFLLPFTPRRIWKNFGFFDLIKKKGSKNCPF